MSGMNEKNRVLTFVFLIASCCLSVFAQVDYRVSGRVVYDGIGVPNIAIYTRSVTDRKWYSSREIVTDKSGDFFFSAPNGTYKLRVRSQKGYVSLEKKVIVTVADRNISNVVFFMEKSCTIFGVARFEDGAPIVGRVMVSNDRGSWRDRIDKSTGKYAVTGILGLEDTEIFFMVEEVLPVRKTINLQAGCNAEENLIVPKHISIKGKVVEKATGDIAQDCGIVIVGSHCQFTSVLNDDGVFYFYNLEPGTYRVACVANDAYVPTYEEVHLNESERKDIIFELEKK